MELLAGSLFYLKIEFTQTFVCRYLSWLCILLISSVTVSNCASFEGIKNCSITENNNFETSSFIKSKTDDKINSSSNFNSNISEIERNGTNKLRNFIINNSFDTQNSSYISSVDNEKANSDKLIHNISSGEGMFNNKSKSNNTRNVSSLFNNESHSKSNNNTISIMSTLTFGSKSNIDFNDSNFDNINSIQFSDFNNSDIHDLFFGNNVNFKNSGTNESSNSDASKISTTDAYNFINNNFGNINHRNIVVYNSSILKLPSFLHWMASDLKMQDSAIRCSQFDDVTCKGDQRCCNVRPDPTWYCCSADETCCNVGFKFGCYSNRMCRLIQE